MNNFLLLIDIFHTETYKRREERNDIATNQLCYIVGKSEDFFALSFHTL